LTGELFHQQQQQQQLEELDGWRWDGVLDEE
jgi:hypothetical protein